MTLYAKLWCDIIGDEKLMRAARKGGKQLDKTPWLIAYAKKRNDNGRLSVGSEAAEPDDLAAGVPNCTPKMMAECTASLEAICVLVRDDDGVLRFSQWDKRNGWSPSDTPDQVRERVANHRARKRGESADVPSSVTQTPNGVTTSVTGEVTTEVTGSVTPPVTTARSREVELDVDKEVELDADSSRVTTTGDPNVVLVAAANRGIRERFGEQPSPIRHSAGSSLEATEAITSAGVPIAFARDAIYTCAKECSLGRAPRSLKYFVGFAIDRWHASEEYRTAAGSDAKALVSTNGASGFGRGEQASFVDVVKRMQAKVPHG